MSSSAKATGWRKPTRPPISARPRPIWWCCRFPTATLALSRRAGIARRAGCRRCGSPIWWRCRHPLSVDTYVEQTLSGAKGILIRLIGGESYWPYGLAQVQDLARRKGIALAVLPADGREDARLDALSTLPESTLRRLQALCDAGGAVAAQAALQQLALAAGLYAGPVAGDKTVPDFGWYQPGQRRRARAHARRPACCAVVTFYRSYLTSADTDPVDALIAALRGARVSTPSALFAASPQGTRRRRHGCAPNSAAWPRPRSSTPRPFRPRGRTARHRRSMRRVARCFRWRCPRRAGRTGPRRSAGLSPADLAMHVVLPEVDGRIFAGVASFKSPSRATRTCNIPASPTAPTRTGSPPSRTGWRAGTGLATTPAAERKLALVLSTYPGKALSAGPCRRSRCAGLGRGDSGRPGGGRVCVDARRRPWHGADDRDHRMAARRLPRRAADACRSRCSDALDAAWGDPEADPSVTDGAFPLHAPCGAARPSSRCNPNAARSTTRDDDYHDLVPHPAPRLCRLLSLAAVAGPARADPYRRAWHAGMAAGQIGRLSETCWPEALTGALPVIYPFIVNDPGEAAQAKRRIGAVTIGHLPPPLAASAVPDGPAPARTAAGRVFHRRRARPRPPRPADRDRSATRRRRAGVEDDLGLPDGCLARRGDHPHRPLCLRHQGKPVRRRAAHLRHRPMRRGGTRRAAGRAERPARRRPAPPARPIRGRSDVLPTGRNLFTTDPRAVPSRAAHAQGVKLAEELLRRHLQDHGDWPKALVVDLWGSATMRTAGEEFAMALHLAGLAPKWDDGSERVSGFEVMPLALLAPPAHRRDVAGFGPVPRRFSRPRAAFRSRRRRACRSATKRRRTTPT